MTALDYERAMTEAAESRPEVGGALTITVGVMVRSASTGNEWVFLESPRPELRYDHKTGRPLLVLARIEGSVSKP